MRQRINARVSWIGGIFIASSWGQKEEDTQLFRLYSAKTSPKQLYLHIKAYMLIYFYLFEEKQEIQL